MSDAQKAALAAARALQKRKDDCDSKYFLWSTKARLANSDEKGTGRSWNLKDKKCNVEWWAFGGKIGPDKPWYDAEVEKAIGKKCDKWRLDRIDNSKITDEGKFPNGKPIKL